MIFQLRTPYREGRSVSPNEQSERVGLDLMFVAEAKHIDQRLFAKEPFQVGCIVDRNGVSRDSVGQCLGVDPLMKRHIYAGDHDRIDIGDSGESARLIGAGCAHSRLNTLDKILFLTVLGSQLSAEIQDAAARSRRDQDLDLHQIRRRPRALVSRLSILLAHAFEGSVSRRRYQGRHLRRQGRGGAALIGGKDRRSGLTHTLGSRKVSKMTVLNQMQRA